MKHESLRIAVIGGGAAGYFAAIHAAQSINEVTILEKSNKVLAKVRVSGGGRCNVTNSCSDTSVLIQGYPRGMRELRGPFSVFSTADTFHWFESRGVSLKVEADGRVFPVTNRSQTIIECLENEVTLAGVQIHKTRPVLSLRYSDPGFEIETSGGTSHYHKVIIASGGSPQLESYEWISRLGINVIPPVPSLFTFQIHDEGIRELSGLSVEKVIITLENSRFESEGPMLFTHWGLSGPAVLKLSAFAARFLNERNYRFHGMINFIPDMRISQFKEWIEEKRKYAGGRHIRNSVPANLPQRLWDLICKRTGVEMKNWADGTRKELDLLISNTTQFSFHAHGKTTFKEEFVTCGGVDLKEVNMRTMESKKIPGLFFAGEVLDIDGITGGYNFQAAWTTGYIAGISAGNK